MNERWVRAIILLFAVACFGSSGMSLYDGITAQQEVKQAKYRQEAEFTVLDFTETEEESEPINGHEFSDSHSVRTDSGGTVKRYDSVETGVLNGEEITITASYYNSPPPATVTHTFISNDGVNWEMNDTDTVDFVKVCICAIVFFIAGVIFSIVWYKGYKYWVLGHKVRRKND